MLYLYQDELELLRRAAIQKGMSMSGYIFFAAYEKAKADLKSDK